MDKAKITSAQFAILMYMYILGEAAIVQPHTIANIAGSDEWFTMILSIFVQLGFGWLYMKLSFKYPDETIIEYSQRILGKGAGWVLGFIYLLFFIILVAYILRVISGFLGSVILPRSPLDIIGLVFMIPVVYGVFLGLGVIGRATEILLPIAVFVFIVSSIMLVPKIDVDNLLPVFPDGIMPSIKGLYSIIGFPTMDVVVVLMLVRFIVDKKKTRKYFYITSAAAPFTLVIIALYTISVLGIEETIRAPYVVYDLAKEIRIERIFERVEALVGIIWISTTFVKITLSFYAVTIAAVQLFKLTSYKYAIIPFLFLTLPMSKWIVNNPAELEYYLGYVYPIFAFFPSFLFPVLLLVIGALKNKKQKSSGEEGRGQPEKTKSPSAE
ncbi:GerAB/ArcD/ProY family transporter [Paenibacillus dokdonensis]|uniref:GerAB/ArcD/ProY family transporter n=1 Tax=Paenibacillus dokdonensis TaxID=2567944 RepID=UPI0010A787E7|nr:endospore germination permease [Paenibacillus dokdonensis]